MNQDTVSFSFGENWKDYLTTVSEEDITCSKRDIQEWLGTDFVAEKEIIDIGSGSGIHSLSFYMLGAKTLDSFDYDEHSVEATKTLWTQSKSPKHWRVSHGSILDDDYVMSLKKYDLVYSWGVLHHTGSMWKALENAFGRVKPGGKIWISLYTKGPHYAEDLALKRKYNMASSCGKQWMVKIRIIRKMFSRLFRFKNPLAWNKNRGRGMNVYHDIVDWLGGLPYEVASPDEVLAFGRKQGFVLEKIKVKREGGCSIYLFSLPD
ncbi:MAG: class I SAM-dependent methyltransferase [Phycisphaeraceae bacterium]|nr:class I SAM-dependent methyltransferase [Phycisphaeraceae bacterium]